MGDMLWISNPRRIMNQISILLAYKWLIFIPWILRIKKKIIKKIKSCVSNKIIFQSFLQKHQSWISRATLMWRLHNLCRLTLLVMTTYGQRWRQYVSAAMMMWYMEKCDFCLDGPLHSSPCTISVRAAMSRWLYVGALRNTLICRGSRTTAKDIMMYQSISR